MLVVVVAFSSMNTSLAGSSRPYSRIQRRRSRAMSARSRSVARMIFFLKVILCLAKNRHSAVRLPKLIAEAG